MRVEQLGEGEPELAVVGAIHGDEPCGSHAVTKILDEQPAVERPVKFVVANERALERGVRYTDADLNRVFPGDPDSEDYERRLAHDLMQELRGCTTLSIHSTQSYDRPFAIVNDADPLIESVCPYLSIDAVVEAGGFTEGRLIEYADVVEVEAGEQGSDSAKEYAEVLVREFLGATGALPGRERHTDELPVYRLERLIPKRPAKSYDVRVANFERVAPGATFATAGDDELVAQEPFYPVLMSSYGYENEFGYAAELTRTLG
ncbi:succinylglutamate desuccinylase/aspartoacylase domain-containing protein [Halomarina ordinaria]|uniref:Succinylglutamate desuccinylase/aspartoacylase family protein n=1 Tax=Halomarina ordinaria TaxID=3033939 RepID=A0ABD5U6Z6_9EURY|nr:succinylglutamate desuccinylase/aspartoacylase family protein [Halomarina sp. PSRA2]